MKVAFLTLSYKSAMYNSLIMAFVNQGHEVLVITPTYDGKSGIRVEDGMSVLFFRSLPMLNIGIVRKGIANFLLPHACMRGIRKFLKPGSIDLILMTTPPISFYRPIKYLKKLNPHARFYLILRDIHPEGAKFIGLDRYKPIYNYFRRIEINLYKLADYIGCMSPRNIRFIADRNPYLEASKLRLCPNWEQDTSYVNPDDTIRQRYDLENKFIVLYGGNMGVPQNLDLILDLAAEKRHLDRVLFLFIGDGTEKGRLQKKAQAMRLSSVRFMDTIPRADFNDILKVCDVGLISLHPNVPIPNIPSKTLGYFAARVPILAAIDPVTDYGQYILDSAHAGLWSLATDFGQLSENFDILYADPELRRRMGENGYNYFREHFTTEKAYAEIMSAIE